MHKVNAVTGERRRRKLAVCLANQGNRCWYCDREITARVATIDHLLPRAHGGRHDQANLVAACQWCNAKRKTMDADKFKAQVQKWAKHNPRHLGPVDFVHNQQRKRAEKRLRKELGREDWSDFASHQQQTRGWHEQDTGYFEEVRL